MNDEEDGIDWFAELGFPIEVEDIVDSDYPII